MVVSISRKDAKIVFFVDDGTDVVRCLKNFYADEEYGHYETITIGKQRWENHIERNPQTIDSRIFML